MPIMTSLVLATRQCDFKRLFNKCHSNERPSSSGYAISLTHQHGPTPFLASYVHLVPLISRHDAGTGAHNLLVNSQIWIPGPSALIRL